MSQAVGFQTAIFIFFFITHSAFGLSIRYLLYIRVCFILCKRANYLNGGILYRRVFFLLAILQNFLASGHFLCYTYVAPSPPCFSSPFFQPLDSFCFACESLTTISIPYRVYGLILIITLQLPPPNLSLYSPLSAAPIINRSR